MISSTNTVPIIDAEDGPSGTTEVVTVRSHDKWPHLVLVRIRDGFEVTVNAADLEQAIANARSSNKYGGGR